MARFKFKYSGFFYWSIIHDVKP